MKIACLGTGILTMDITKKEDEMKNLCCLALFLALFIPLSWAEEPFVIKTLDKFTCETTKPVPAFEGDPPNTEVSKFYFYVANLFPGSKNAAVIAKYRDEFDYQAFFPISGETYFCDVLDSPDGSSSCGQDRDQKTFLLVQGDSDGCNYVEMLLRSRPDGSFGGYVKDTGSEVEDWYVTLNAKRTKVDLGRFDQRGWNRLPK